MNEQPKQENIITEIVKKIKIKQPEVVLGVAIILITVISFNLGKISALNNQKTPIKITGGENIESAKTLSVPKATPMRDQTVVVSKNSKGKLYHFNWCPGASQIAEKNKITFLNETAAITAGYILAGNCRK